MSHCIPKVPTRADEPLASKDGVPIAFEVLGAQFHLDELSPDDEDRIDEAMAAVHDWIGPRLTWAHTTAFGDIEPYEPEHLEYVTTYPRKLRLPKDVADIPIEQRTTAIGLLAQDATEYGVACGSSPIEDYEHAQVTSFRFYADVTRIFPERTHLSAYSVLRVTVPSDTPLDEFEARVRSLAAQLPVRWGTAGLMLSGAEGEYWKDWKQVAFAYCARYPGIDVGEYAALTEEFYDFIRTVNWLTFLGPTMLRDLNASVETLRTEPSVAVEEFPSGLVLLRAGASPQRGDKNRRDIPSAYSTVDGMVRARRCDGTDDQGDEVSFFGEWKRMQEWFRRFER